MELSLNPPSLIWACLTNYSWLAQNRKRLLFSLMTYLEERLGLSLGSRPIGSSIKIPTLSSACGKVRRKSIEAADFGNHKQQFDAHHIHNYQISFPVISTPLLHTAMSTNPGFVIFQATTRKVLSLHWPNSLDSIDPPGYNPAQYQNPMISLIMVGYFRLLSFNQ